MSLLPGVACHHAVLSLGHSVEGTLTVDGAFHPLSGGWGYTEKDWGRRFPESYLWLQCNHFERRPTASLVLSWARVPWGWGRRAFEGFVVGFWHPGGFARFATYTGAAFERLEVDARRVRVIARGGGEELEVIATRPDPSGDPLYLPDGRAMVLGTLQTIDAEVQVRLKRAGRVEFEAVGRNGAMETKEM